MKERVGAVAPRMHLRAVASAAGHELVLHLRFVVAIIIAVRGGFVAQASTTRVRGNDDDDDKNIEKNGGNDGNRFRERDDGIGCPGVTEGQQRRVAVGDREEKRCKQNNSGTREPEQEAERRLSRLFLVVERVDDEHTVLDDVEKNIDAEPDEKHCQARLDAIVQAAADVGTLCAQARRLQEIDPAGGVYGDDDAAILEVEQRKLYKKVGVNAVGAQAAQEGEPEKKDEAQHGALDDDEHHVDVLARDQHVHGQARAVVAKVANAVGKVGENSSRRAVLDLWRQRGHGRGGHLGLEA